MIKAILFDLDGVLTATSEEHFLAWKELFLDLGYDLSEEYKDKVRGVGRRESLELLLESFGIEKNFTEEEKVALMTKKNDIYKGMIENFNEDNLESHALELLEFLKGKKIKMVIASSSKNAPMLLKKMKIDDYFDAVVDPARLKATKPDPEIFLKAASLVDTEPKDCLGLEDAEAGIEALRAAGVFAVGIGIEDNTQESFKSIGDFYRWFKGREDLWLQ